MAIDGQPVERARVDARSVLLGAGVDLLVVVPAGFIGRAVSNDGSNLAVPFALLVLFVGPFLGGAVAARGHRGNALVHGASAAAVGWAVTIAISVVGKLIDNKGVPIVASIAVGVISVSFGVIGGYVTFRRELAPGGD